MSTSLSASVPCIRVLSILVADHEENSTVVKTLLYMYHTDMCCADPHVAISVHYSCYHGGERADQGHLVHGQHHIARGQHEHQGTVREPGRTESKF